MLLSMLLAPLASAQRADPPTFGLEAPASCTGAAAGYTCTSSAVVTGYNPIHARRHGTQKQFGCAILNFTLESGTTTPFGPFWATVTDSDTSESAGPNGCTYEPTSNNGVVIVRYLKNSSSPIIQTYSIVNTGILP
jgi:hypothetical protein